MVNVRVLIFMHCIMNALVQASLPYLLRTIVSPKREFLWLGGFSICGREKEYLVPTLKQSHSLSSTKASFTLLTLYNYTTSTLLSFGVTGHLHHDLLWSQIS